jgi:hypothetical protein
MITKVAEPTALVVTLNVALVAPAATVTLGGTVAAALPLVSVTTAPPIGAGAFSVTVPVEELSPLTLAGLNDTAESPGAVTITVADLCVPS